MVILTSSIFLTRVCTKKSNLPPPVTSKPKKSCLVGMNQCDSGYFCKATWVACTGGPTGDLCHGYCTEETEPKKSCLEGMGQCDSGYFCKVTWRVACTGGPMMDKCYG